MDFNAASILTLFIGLVLGGGTIYAIIILTGAGAGKKAEKIINEAKKQVKNILDPAKKEISDAENARMEAIKEFNEKYGVYTETFSGDKAVEQYNRVLNQFNSTFENFWKPFYNWLF